MSTPCAEGFTVADVKFEIESALPVSECKGGGFARHHYFRVSNEKAAYSYTLKFREPYSSEKKGVFFMAVFAGNETPVASVADVSRWISLQPCLKKHIEELKSVAPSKKPEKKSELTKAVIAAAAVEAGFKEEGKYIIKPVFHYGAIKVEFSNMITTKWKLRLVDDSIEMHFDISDVADLKDKLRLIKSCFRAAKK